MDAAPTFDSRLARARFRAWHRGTREADLLIGGYFDRYHAQWDEAGLAWFEALLDADEADVLAWAMDVWPAPAFFHGQQLCALKKLDYVTIL
jgi:antitoxin CptB